MQGATTRTEPWAEQIPYLTAGFEEAGRLYGKGVPDYYPGATLAGFDPAQTAAQQATLGYAMGPRPAAMQAAAENVTLGQMGGQTPFSGGQMSDLLAGRVDRGAGSPYAAMADVYGQQYQSQLSKALPAIRQQMVEYQPGGGSRGDIVQGMAEASASKNLAQNLAQMYGAIGDVGGQRRAMTQEAINQAQAKYQYEQGRDQNALQQYMANISGDYGGTTTQTPSGLSQLGQLIGIMGGAKAL